MLRRIWDIVDEIIVVSMIIVVVRGGEFLVCWGFSIVLIVKKVLVIGVLNFIVYD